MCGHPGDQLVGVVGLRKSKRAVFFLADDGDRFDAQLLDELRQREDVRWRLEVFDDLGFDVPVTQECQRLATLRSAWIVIDRSVRHGVCSLTCVS